MPIESKNQFSGALTVKVFFEMSKVTNPMPNLSDMLIPLKVSFLSVTRTCLFSF